MFVNGDDDLLPTLKETLGGKVVTFGLGPTCDWRAYGLNEADKGTFFTCLSPAGEKTEVFVPAAGEHNVRNALAAMAVARYLGVPAEDAVRAISAYKAPAMRQQVVEAGGLLIIDDSYNASPDSMRSAIDVLATRPVTGKRAAVLADMLELGDFSQQGHYEVGSYARERGVELLVAVGPLAKGIAAGYGPGGPLVCHQRGGHRLFTGGPAPRRRGAGKGLPRDAHRRDCGRPHRGAGSVNPTNKEAPSRLGGRFFCAYVSTVIAVGLHAEILPQHRAV